MSHDRARELLGVDHRASGDDIRRAYRRQARRHHPDTGGDAATFQQLVAAVDLLLERAEAAEGVATSPSTGRRAYPSTAGQYQRAGSGADGAEEVDTSLLEGARPTATGDRWSVAGLAAAVVAALADDELDRVGGASRRPGSFLNRFARYLSDDLLARWEVTREGRRGVAGPDLEIVATFPPGARRRVDRANPPPAWTTTRNPGRTVSSRVVSPEATVAATAIRVAEALDGFCRAIGWPLEDWYRTK